MREGWQTKKLGELGKVITGSTPSTKDENNYSSSDVCFVKPSDIGKTGISHIVDTEFHISFNAYQHSRKLPKGSVLTTCIGIIGKVGLLDVDATCNQQINAIIPDKRIITSSFLAYSILSKRHLLTAIANAPVVPIINKGEFSSVFVDIPQIKVQEMIVDELDSLSEIVAKKKEQLKELDKLAQSIFYDMFGDPINNEKGWPVKKLAEIADTFIGITYKPENVVDSGGTIVLRSSNIQESELDFNDIVRVNVPIKEKHYVRPGDILMCSRNGSFRLVGKVARIKPLPEEMSFGAFMTVIRSLHNDYLFAFFKSSAFRSQLTTAKTATINQITTKMLDAISVSLPPLDLQIEFARKTEAIEKQKELIKQSTAETETLFNSRMDYWFN